MKNDLDSFISNVENYWVSIKEGNSSAANRCEKANRKLVEKWKKQGIAFGMLEPLLDYPSNAIRLFAAAYLINIERQDKYVMILRNLVENDSSLISSSAAAVLRLNNYQV